MGRLEYQSSSLVESAEFIVGRMSPGMPGRQTLGKCGLALKCGEVSADLTELGREPQLAESLWQGSMP